MPRKKATPVADAGATLDAPTKELRSPFTALEDILKRKNSPIEQKQIAYELIHLVGGPRGLAKKIMEEYKATKPGSMARAKFFDIVLKLMRIAFPHETGDNLDFISDEDIARVLREQVAGAGVSELGYPTHVCI